MSPRRTGKAPVVSIGTWESSGQLGHTSVASISPSLPATPAASMLSAGLSSALPSQASTSRTSNSKQHHDTLIAANVGVFGGILVFFVAITTWRLCTSRRTYQLNVVQRFGSWRKRRPFAANAKPPCIGPSSEPDATVLTSTSSSRIAEGSGRTAVEERTRPGIRHANSVSTAAVREAEPSRRALSPTRERFESPPSPSSPPDALLVVSATTYQHQDSGIRLAPAYLEEIPPPYSRE